MNFHFAQSAEEMQRSVLRGDQLHVFEENGDDGQLRLVCNVENSRLTLLHAHAVAARAFRKHDEMKFLSAPTEVLQFIEAIRVEFSALEEKTDFTA